MSTVDALIDLAVNRAVAEEGGAGWLVANGHQVRGVFATSKANRQPNWTPEEKEYLQKNMYSMTIGELARILGRSEQSLHIKIVRWKFERPSKRTGYLTGNQVARSLGSDIHSVMRMFREGIMPLHIVHGERGIMQISQVRLYMWAINPKNWIYFKVHRMKDLHLQRLVTLAKSRWNDEWLTIGQAAEVLGIHHQYLNDRINKGQLKASQWGNWWIRRSDLGGVVVIRGKGRKGYSTIFTPAADAFLVRAMGEGISLATIGRMMKIGDQTVRNRWVYLKGISEVKA